MKGTEGVVMSAVYKSVGIAVAEGTEGNAVSEPVISKSTALSEVTCVVSVVH